MRHTLTAELDRLWRRRVVLPTAIAILVVSVGAATLVLLTVNSSAAGPGPSTAELSRAGGGTLVFRTATAFAGVFVFVVIAGMTAVEYSRGTMRTMLLQQPNRLGLLAGRLLGLLTFAAGVLAISEVLTWLVALVIAPSRGIDTGSWLSFAGVGAGIVDYLAVLFWLTVYALLATVLATLIRSVPLTLGVGIAWAGPIEHIIQNAWSPATQIFPGLLLEAFASGGTPQVGATAALATTAAYGAVAGVISFVVFRFRDVA